ncbi:MAG: hypothetical protein FWC89_10820 [Defluviitaleaceae bacterium]|nr:hypothetical protein [Defluviitaleaceae bacterium]
MPEMVLSVSSLQETLFKMIPTERVKLRQNDGIISLIPFREVTKDECPLLGIAADSTLTVDKFLAMTREDKLLEGLDI